VKAVILVGGFGTRLRPLTLHTPKQMLPVVNRPMIEWVIGHLARFGVDLAVLAMGYRPDDFSAAYPDGTCAGVGVRYAVEPEPLDTAGAIRFAATDAGIDERVVVVNGDVLTDLDVGALVALHDRVGAEATIALHEVDDPSRYGVVDIDDEGRVRAFVEKPVPGTEPTNLINAGTYVLEPSALDRIAQGRRVSIERETFPAMVADGTLFATADGGVYWLDTGTPDAYLRAQVDVLEGRRSVPERVDPLERDPSARVAPSAVVRSSVLAAGAQVGEGAEIIESVLHVNATVGAGAHVHRSIVGEGATVGDGASVRGLSVIGYGESVAAGADLQGARIPAVDE